MSRFAAKEFMEAVRSGASQDAVLSDAAAEALKRLSLERMCSSARDEWSAIDADTMHNELRLSIVVFGASGDLAKKKTYPALFELFRKG